MVIVTELDVDNMFVSAIDDEYYEAETLCANWNPDLSSFAGQVVTCEQKFTGRVPADLLEADADEFLSRMYLCQE